MTRFQRDLKRLPHVAQVLRTRSGHYRLVLANGKSTVTSGTPGDVRAIKNTLARVRRSIRDSSNQQTTQETI
jgi:hypothetical protein